MVSPGLTIRFIAARAAARMSSASLLSEAFKAGIAGAEAGPIEAIARIASRRTRKNSSLPPPFLCNHRTAEGHSDGAPKGVASGMDSSNWGLLDVFQAIRAASQHRARPLCAATCPIWRPHCQRFGCMHKAWEPTAWSTPVSPESWTEAARSREGMRIAVSTIRRPIPATEEPRSSCGSSDTDG